jgi:cyanophycinase
MKYPSYMLRIRSIALISLLFSFVPSFSAQALPATAYQYVRIGTPADSTAATTQPGYALMGGGKDLDEAFRWLCDRAGGGDFLVLRATGSGDYNPYVQKLCKLNSVATLIVPSRGAAADPFVEHAIRHASALFIAGGDQANYINFWQGTPVESALNDAIARGVPIGGTSAGLAVLGEFAYTAQGDRPDDPNLDSKSALANPWGRQVVVGRGLVNIPILKGIVPDTHFAKRDRMGRLLVFLARLNAANSDPPAAHPIRGVGVDEGCAVLVEPDGKAAVVGRGIGAWFVGAVGPAQVLRPGEPLTFRKSDVQKVAPGHAFDLKVWRGDAVRYSLSVNAGTIQSSQTGGGIY